MSSKGDVHLPCRFARTGGRKRALRWIARRGAFASRCAQTNAPHTALVCSSVGKSAALLMRMSQVRDLPDQQCELYWRGSSRTGRLQPSQKTRGTVQATLLKRWRSDKPRPGNSSRPGVGTLFPVPASSPTSTPQGLVGGTLHTPDARHREHPPPRRHALWDGSTNAPALAASEFGSDEHAQARSGLAAAEPSGSSADDHSSQDTRTGNGICMMTSHRRTNQCHKAHTPKQNAHGGTTRTSTTRAPKCNSDSRGSHDEP